MLLKDKKVIVTGGPTREWLDPVRFLSNPSSGKMGISIADYAETIAGEVVFIHGPINNTLVKDCKYKTVEIESTEDMLNAVLGELTDNSILIMSAAPADYTVNDYSESKIKKQGDEFILKLKRTPDILKNVAEKREKEGMDNIFVVGFAAETENVEEYAIGKLRSKNLDMICLNDVSVKGAGFGSDTNIVIIYNRDEMKIQLPILSKKDVAVKIFDNINRELLKRK